ncbi:hypothetical protein [Streptomyces sp. NPDC048252]|uniref:hypothetical protein n=1 Tax=Streptomyces sp. NPDC048252 TaxID=3154612 RepID=UPI00342E71B6
MTSLKQITGASVQKVVFPRSTPLCRMLTSRGRPGIPGGGLPRDTARPPGDHVGSRAPGTNPDHAAAEARPTAAGDPERRCRRWPQLAAMGVVLCAVITATPVALTSGYKDDREGVSGTVPGLTRSPSGSAPGSSAVTELPGASAAPGASEVVTRLRNTRTGLCLDVAAPAEMVGAPTVTAECGVSATQVWWWEDMGRLRSQAVPELDGEKSGDTRYDLAADGLLTLAAEPGVALTPDRRAEGSIIILEPVPQDRIRRSQRWRTDEALTPAPSRSQFLGGQRGVGCGLSGGPELGKPPRRGEGEQAGSTSDCSADRGLPTMRYHGSDRPPGPVPAT